MVCEKCGNETKGIKLNGKLFCTNCGEALEASQIQAPAPQPVPQTTPPKEVVVAPVVPLPNLASALSVNPPEPKGEPVISATVPPEITPIIPAEPPEPKVITGEGDDLSKKQKGIEALKAEEEALKMIESAAAQKALSDKREATKEVEIAQKEAKEKAIQVREEIVEKIAQTEIKKHNRDRITHKKETVWTVFPNEPDPVGEPEIETPTEDQIEEPKEKLAEIKYNESDLNLASPKKIPPEPKIKSQEKNEYPLLDKKKTEKIQEKRKSHQKILNEFLKSTAAPTDPAKEKPKKEKKKKRKKSGHKKLFVILIIFAVLILGFVGLVLYVNFYAINPDRAKNSAESTISFGYKKPSYVPNGYELSYKTNAGKDFINYVYEYSPDKSKTLEIKISKSDLTKENFFVQKIQSLGKNYSQTKAGDIDLYFIEENGLYFLNNGLFYEITASGQLSQEELTKIAGGLL